MLQCQRHKTDQDLNHRENGKTINSPTAAMATTQTEQQAAIGLQTFQQYKETNVRHTE
jgi:hypothetical protein